MDHDRQARRSSHRELTVEERPLRFAGGKIMEVVEPGFADGHDARVLEQVDEFADPCSVLPPGVVRVDPEGRRHALHFLGNPKRSTTGGDPRADRDDPRNAYGAGPLDQKSGGLVAPVQMGVGVDHEVLITRVRSRRGRSSRRLLEPGKERRCRLDSLRLPGEAVGDERPVDSHGLAKRRKD